MDAVATNRELLLDRNRSGNGPLSKTELAAAINQVRIPDGQLKIGLKSSGASEARSIAGQSFAAIAEVESITHEYNSQNIGLAFSSPKILMAIGDGRQRPDVSAYQLSKVKIPASWPDQDALFL